MSYKWVLIGMAISAAACSGCCAPCASTGWKFEVGRPATFNTPGLVQQLNGPLQVAPLGSTVPPMFEGMTAQLGPARLAAPVCPPAPARMQMQAAAPECTLHDVCAALQRIEARLAGPARFMPNAPKQE